MKTILIFILFLATQSTLATEFNMNPEAYEYKSYSSYYVRAKDYIHDLMSKIRANPTQVEIDKLNKTLTEFENIAERSLRKIAQSKATQGYSPESSGSTIQSNRNILAEYEYSEDTMTKLRSQAHWQKQNLVEIKKNFNLSRAIQSASYNVKIDTNASNSPNQQIKTVDPIDLSSKASGAAAMSRFSKVISSFPKISRIISAVGATVAGPEVVVGGTILAVGTAGCSLSASCNEALNAKIQQDKNYVKHLNYTTRFSNRNTSPGFLGPVVQTTKVAK